MGVGPPSDWTCANVYIEPENAPETTALRNLLITNDYTSDYYSQC